MANQEQTRRGVSGESAGWSGILFILAGLLALGAGLSVWRYGQVNERMRDALLEEVTLISWALRADLVDGLRGDEGDIGTIDYERIKAQLAESRRLFPYYRFLYLMRQVPGESVVFLADSEPPDSPDYSPPGQIYDEASPVLRRAFADAQAVTEGPMKDRWGVWYSAFVPVFHPYTNEMIALLGADIEATTWRGDVLKATVPPVIATSVLMILAVAFFRLRHVPLERRSNRNIQRWEIAVSGCFGLVLTIALSLAVHENEEWRRHQAFRRIATVHASALQQMLFRIGDNYLEGIARLFESSDFVDRDEFARYTGFLLNRPYAVAWAWATHVEPGRLSEFEQLVRDSGVSGFRAWRLDDRQAPVPPEPGQPSFPISYVEPQNVNRSWLGFDFAADPEHAAAMEEARRSGSLAATAARLWPGMTTGLVTAVFRPVFNRVEEGRLSGLAVAFLSMDTVLGRALSRESASQEPIAYVELYELTGGTPRFLVASDHRTEGWLLAHRGRQVGLDGLGAFSAPTFAFGRVYGMISEPTDGFFARYPAREGLRIFLVGLIVTGLVTSLVSVLSNRRAKLEREVLTRTADLKNSEESYRGLFNAIRQSIYIQDADGAFVDVNDGAVKRYGYSREEFIGRTPEFLSAPGRNDLNHMRACFSRAWAGEPQYFEFWGRGKSGEIFPKDVWLCKGTYLGKEVVIAIASDISERKKSEEENRRLQAQLMQSQKLESIGRLAGGVAHDFNNMLQAIIGNTNLAKQELAPGAMVAEYLAEIEQSAHRSARLTRQLLAFASKQTIQPRILDLNDTLAGMLKMLQRLIGENIQLSWRPGPNLWPVKIDPGQIDQILANLAVNARDAIPGAGTIEIETFNYTCQPDSCRRVCHCCKPCHYVVITVRDSGCGMNDEVREHLFEPFYTTKDPGKGTGLGLATVFGIVQQNDGVIEVDSSPGVGTTFRIMLPRAEGAVAGNAAPAAEEAVTGRETVLLVEDEAVILQVSMISLQRLGYSVLVASTPAIALRIASEYPAQIHLLITDVILPDLNGPELARRISAIKPGIRCLFMSGYTADVIADRGILDETVHFIQKPFTIQDLAAKIRAVLDGPA